MLEKQSFGQVCAQVPVSITHGSYDDTSHDGDDTSHDSDDDTR